MTPGPAGRDEDGRCHGDDHPDGRNAAAEHQLLLVLDGHEAEQNMGHSKVVLAAILAGLILAGILAATMSTADSQMLAAASSVSQNILQEFAHLKAEREADLFAARLTIVCVSVVGVVLARDPNSSVFGIVSFAWAGFGGAFGAVVLCALFWKRCNWQGALAGMLSGGLMVFVWKYLVSPLGGVFCSMSCCPPSSSRWLSAWWSAL